MRTQLIAMIVTLVSLLGVAPARALPDDTWVVAIGNNRGDPEDATLRYAVRDATALADVLRAEGGVPSDRIRLLVDEDAASVRRAVLEVNGAIRARLADGPRATALVVFYSGHADAEALHLDGTHLGIDELRSMAQGSAASLRLLVVDACRAGALTRVKGLRGAPEFVVQLDNQVPSEGLAIITSSARGETSQEADHLRASFFSHHLVSGLRGAADSDGDGRVTLAEAYAYAYARTVHSSGQTLALQHPTYSYDVKGHTDVVLTSPGLRARGTGRLHLGPPLTYVVSEEHEDGPVVAEVSPARAGAVLALPAGRYFVQRRDEREYREYVAQLAADGDVDLASLPSRSVRYDELVRKGGGARPSVSGLSLLAGVGGGMLDGEGAMPTLVAAYTADLRFATFGVRVRGATAALDAVDQGLPSRHYELGVGLLAERVADFRWFSLALGATVEGVYHAQRFATTTRAVTARDGFGPAFGVLAAIERRVLGGLEVRVEGGPLALVTRTGTVSDGTQVGSTLSSTVTWYLAGGLVWRL